MLGLIMRCNLFFFCSINEDVVFKSSRYDECYYRCWSKSSWLQGDAKVNIFSNLFWRIWFFLLRVKAWNETLFSWTCIQSLGTLEFPAITVRFVFIQSVSKLPRERTTWQSGRWGQADIDPSTCNFVSLQALRSSTWFPYVEINEKIDWEGCTLAKGHQNTIPDRSP